MNDLKNKYRGCLVGLATGDALGVPLEFQPRDAMPLVTEMIGNGPFHLKPGEWTDDTTMALCLGQSLLDCDGFDAEDQMKKYWDWVEGGYMSSTGKMFDIGDTTAAGLCRYRKTGDPMAGLPDESASGNGSIMRLAPIPLFYQYDDQGFLLTYARSSSATTHGSQTCLDGCTILALLIHRALQGEPKEAMLRDVFVEPSPIKSIEAINIAKGSYKTKAREQIQSSGYVIHTLEAALWSFYNTDNFEDGAILAVNLADDSDTTGAVYGQLAGAYYGYDAIPKRWLDKLAKLDLILEMADKLYNSVQNKI